MHGEQLGRSIRNIQADPGRMQLLRILVPQLEQLVCEGQPDLHTLYNALYQEKLVSPKELHDLRVTFALDSVGDQSPQRQRKLRPSFLHKIRCQKVHWIERSTA